MVLVWVEWQAVQLIVAVDHMNNRVDLTYCPRMHPKLEVKYELISTLVQEVETKLKVQ